MYGTRTDRNTNDFFFLQRVPPTFPKNRTYDGNIMVKDDLPPIDFFKFATKDSGQVCSLVAHGILVNGTKFLNGLKSKTFGQVFHHT